MTGEAKAATGAGWQRRRRAGRREQAAPRERGRRRKMEREGGGLALVLGRKGGEGGKEMLFYFLFCKLAQIETKFEFKPPNTSPTLKQKLCTSMNATKMFLKPYI